MVAYGRPSPDHLRGMAAVPPPTNRVVLVRRIYAFMEERLGDHELSPGGIAAAHNISLRYLHKLFEPEDATVAGWIRRRRMERCARDLTDPALVRRPASAIAARWGFPNAAHFNRLFRAHYGVPPGEFRRRHLGLGPSPWA